MSDVIERGLAAYRRQQQRFTDAADRAALDQLILVSGGVLVLDPTYGITLRVTPEHLQEPPPKKRGRT